MHELSGLSPLEKGAVLPLVACGLGVRKLRWPGRWVTWACLVAACAEEPEGATESVVPAHGAQLIMQHCAACHGADGPGRPTLNDGPSLEAARAAVARSVASGRMPPWLPDEEGCVPFEDSRRLENADRAAIIAWAQSGAPAGQVEPVEAGLRAELGPPQLTVSTGPVEVQLQGPDDGIACFRVVERPTQPFWISAVGMRPQPSAVVHHLNLFVAKQTDFDDPANLDVGCPKLGSFHIVDSDIGLHYPKRLPAGALVAVRPDEVLYFNVHVSTAGQGYPPSQPVLLTLAADLWLGSETGGREQLQIDLTPPDFVIPAGATDFVASDSYTFTEPARLNRVMPHMHRFGASFRADIVHSDGSRECLLSVPRWDFFAHEPYNIAEGRVVSVQPGDRLEYRCVYDNSALHQPAVGTGLLEPRDVINGWRVTDEMCVFAFQGWQP